MSCHPYIEPPAANGPNECDPNVTVAPSRSREGRAKSFYVFPWDGAVDLYAIAAIQAENDSLVIQLHGGGFLRCQRHHETRKVVSNIIALLASLDGVHVTLHREV